MEDFRTLQSLESKESDYGILGLTLRDHLKYATRDTDAAATEQYKCYSEIDITFLFHVYDERAITFCLYSKIPF